MRNKTQIIIRLIIGALIPVPIAAMVVSIVWVTDGGLWVADLPLFYLLMILLGYSLVGIQSIGYSLIMEFVALKIPFIRNHIILYTLFSVAVVGLLTAIPFRRLGDDEMLLFLGFFTGAAMALILCPLTKTNLHNKQPHSDVLKEPLS